MGGTLSQPESTTIKLPEAGKPGPQGPVGPAGPPGDPMILLTSPQFKDALTASSFYCPDGKDYCSVPKKSIVDFDFLMNKNLDVYGKLNSNNALTIGNDLILSRADRATIYPSVTNNSLQIRSNGSGNLQLNQDNNGNILLANGGGRVGLGTLDPKTPLHVKGNGGLLNLEGKDHGYIQYYPRGFVGGRKSYVGVAGANDTSFYIVNEDTGNIELGSNNNICFSYKPTSTSSSKKVCISDIVNKTGL